MSWLGAGNVADPRALGIDLGTTFSVVSQINDFGMPAVLPNAEGAATTPSVVFFDGENVVVGEVARESLATEPESVVQLVKRHMGSEWSFDHSGVTYRPEHVSALILRKLHQDARRLAGSVGGAVITVPAYFNDTMRSATRRAGELAGIEVLGLLSEPTAAALAFGFDRRPAGLTGVVIDLGGGTFDVTVLDYDGANLSVRATGGDAYLGGANFDKVIFDYLAERFGLAHGIDINDPEALSLEECVQVSRDWLMRATRAKHDLTARERTVVLLQAAGLTLRVEIRRETFLDRAGILLDEVTEKILSVLADASVRPADVGVVLAVGGSSRIPAVRDRISGIFGAPPDTSVSPDEAVALGAALFAAQRQLDGGGRPALQASTRQFLEQLTVTDVTAHTLGVPAHDPRPDGRSAEIVAQVLLRNTALPAQAERSFFTMHPGETTIVVPVLEGEDSDPGLCRRIGEVIIGDLPAGRPAYQRVSVTMRLDRDGILHVSATDHASGAAASTTIVHAYLPRLGDKLADHAVRTLTVE